MLHSGNRVAHNAGGGKRLLALVGALFVIGGTVSIVGSYWDDAWHTNRGRDDFFIAPHIALYAGVLLAGGGIAAWAMAAVRGRGWQEIRSDRPLLLALLGLAATLGAAPIDNGWHVAFGRDAVIWSPPHALGIFGLLALGVAMLVLLRDLPASRWREGVRAAVCGMTVGAPVFLVAEYETDVPQFDPAFYLPVLATGSIFAFEVVRHVTGWRWGATVAAAAHAVLMALVALFLTVVAGWDFPLLPLLVIPAVVLDVTGLRAWRWWLRAAVFTTVLLTTYGLYVNAARVGVFLEAGDIALSLPMALLGTGFVLAGLELLRPNQEAQKLPRVGTAATLLALAVAATLQAAPLAAAHDPGQGEESGSLDLTIHAEHGRARFDATINQATLCREVEPLAVVARRSGDEVRGELTKSGCRLHGAVPLPDHGRWFVYAELHRGHETIASWLPIKRKDGPTRIHDHDRYLYVVDESAATTVQIVAGVILYALALALLTATAWLATRSGRRTSRAVADRSSS